MSEFSRMPKLLDENEAPEGFIAVLKDHAKPADGSNICRACDWRKICQNPSTDLTIHNHRCMDYTSFGVDGREIKRHDGCSVLFKTRG